MSDTAQNAVRILIFSFDDAALRRLDNRRRNQLFACMHAHNELTFLNRLLLFVQNSTADGELHDHAQSIQIWSALQVLAGKLFETWKMLDKRILREPPANPIIGTLTADYAAALTWLRDYFGAGQYKNNAIKIIRDKTAFHYDGLDLGQAINNLADREAVVYLAEHPANTLYYLGSAVTFRAIFTLIADSAISPAGRSFDDRLDDGFRIVIEDVKAANWHQHQLLYGFVKAMLEDMAGGELGEAPEVTTVTNPPAPDTIGLPPWLDMLGMKS